MRHALAALACLLALPFGAQARDIALVIGNEDYTRLEPVRRADNTAGLVRALEEAGMEVFDGTNLARDEMRELASDFVEEAEAAERLLVVLYGRFVTTDRDRFVMPVDAAIPSLIDLQAEGFDIGPIETVLATKPRGRAILAMGDDGQARPLPPYLTRGIGELDPEPGFVTVAGTVRRVNAFLLDVIADPDGTYDIGTAGERRLAMFGLIEGRPMRFLGGGDSRAEAEARREREAWAEAERLDTEDAYRAYLERFPRGPQVRTARSRIEAIANDPARRARLAEEAMRLTRDDRRAVQSDLTVLGFDTRGVDGIFGSGTRGAVAAFQRSKGLEATGFLDPALVALIDAEAARKEAEAAAARAEREQADRDFWRQTGAGGGEQGARDYLARYPEGLFAQAARDRLAAARDQRSPDRRAYDRAREIDTVAAYQAYLIENPGGGFREQAIGRINALQQAGGTNVQAREQERALSLNGVTRTLIEERLRAFGANPGPVDGVFDERFRAALRSYQSARGLPATGYVTQDAVVMLLADSILR